MRIRDEYLHGSDLTGVVKKIEVTTGTGNNANKSVIKYIKADSEGGVVEVPIGDITGKAATASKLDNTSAIGSTTNPVYFTANGVPSACTYSLNATVPVGAANQVLYYSAPNTLDTQSYTTLTSNLDVFTAATSSAAGKKGLVPAPSANQLGTGNFFLRADGIWTVIESKSAALNGTATSLVTTGEKYNWNSAYNWYNSMTSGDTDGIINKWKEVEAFLANYGDSSTLAAELAKLVTLSTDQTITGVKTFSLTISGSITGNAGTANKLKNTVNINGVAFDGSTDITITAAATGGNSDTVGGYSPSDFLLKTEHETFESVIATAFTDLDNRKIEASDIPTSLPANGGNADTATKLQTARTIWGQSFDGTGNVSGNLTLGNDIIYGADSRNAFQPSGTDLYIGSGYTASGDRTFLYGNVIRMYTGTGSQSMVINPSGGVTIGDSDKAGTDTKLFVNGKAIFSTDVLFYNWAYMRTYLNDGSEHSVIGVNNNNILVINDGKTIPTIIRGGNVGIGTTTPSSKLHVAGDIFTTDGFKKEGSDNSYVLLGGGGHKAESSLSVNYAASAGNADTLDNFHASSFYENGYVMFKHTIDASGLDTNTWYPVIMPIDAFNTVRIEVRVSLNSGTTPPWSTHESGGFSVRKIWEVNGYGWGTNQINRRILESDYLFASTDPVRGIGQLTSSSTEYVYVRGGGKYYFYTSHNVPCTLCTTTYTISNLSVSPTTTTPKAININVGYYCSNAGNADTLDGKHDGELTALYFSTGTILTSNDSINCLLSGVYSYISGNNPTGSIGNNCILVSFRDKERTDTLQIVSATNEKALYYRIAGNIGNSYELWTEWRELIHSDNIGSQSVKYATTAGTATNVDWSGVTNRPTNVSAFTNDKGYLTSHAYSYGSIDIYDVNGTKKTSDNTVSASVNTETLRLQEGANISITATNSGTSGSDNIKIAVTGITSNIDRNGYGQLALWNNGASEVSTTLQSATYNETLTVKAGSGIDFSGYNGAANKDVWTISAIPYNCAITLSNNSEKSLIKDSWSADKDSVYLTSDGTSGGTSLAAGTYALWIEDRSSSSGTPNYYSGTFTCAGSATAGRLDEIALHSSMATNADTNAPTRIFVATQISSTSGKHVLRFCSLDSSTTNHYLTVKVNRII